MRRLAFLFLFFCIIQHLPAQTIQWLTSGTKTHIRGLCPVNEQVIWVSGNNGTVGKSVDGGQSWQWTIVPGFEKRDFRDIEAFDENTAVIIAIAEPAHILKTSDGGKNWKIVFTDSTKGMFLDAMDFSDEKNGIVVGDPVNGKFFLAVTEDGGEHWSPVATADSIRPKEGEAFFAASGSNIRLMPGHSFGKARAGVSKGSMEKASAGVPKSSLRKAGAEIPNNSLEKGSAEVPESSSEKARAGVANSSLEKTGAEVPENSYGTDREKAGAKIPKSSFWMVSGGTLSRLHNGIQAWPLPLLQGKETTGANAIAIEGERAVIVGGDFAADTASYGNCVLVSLKDQSMRPPVTPPHGYRSCVAFISPQKLISSGTSGIDISADGGLNWQLVTRDGFHVCRKAKKGTAVFLAGSNGRVAKLNW